VAAHQLVALPPPVPPPVPPPPPPPTSAMMHGDVREMVQSAVLVEHEADVEVPLKQRSPAPPPPPPNAVELHGMLPPPGAPP
jgi:hypothetical protein